jgi:hypothetical protein
MQITLLEPVTLFDLPVLCYKRTKQNLIKCTFMYVKFEHFTTQHSTFLVQETWKPDVPEKQMKQHDELYSK